MPKDKKVSSKDKSNMECGNCGATAKLIMNKEEKRKEGERIDIDAIYCGWCMQETNTKTYHVLCRQCFIRGCPVMNKQDGDY